jgi:NAD(P)-dependent dehydrogenase (short-subunit alcohol dehydrogenase family)
LNLYLANKNVKAVAVHPGWIRTDMGGQNADNDPYEAACKLVKLFNAIGKPGEAHLFFDLNGKECPW